MTFTPENIFFVGAVLIFASIVISKWGYRFGVSTLLLFLFTGMLFGSDGLGLVLSTLGVMLTTVVTGLLIFYLSEWTNMDIGLTLPMSMLLAATVSSTDSASVFNLLRSQHIGLKHNLRPTLELESGSNDPMAYVLTIALVEAIVSAGTLSGMDLAAKIVGQLAVGGLLGYLSGLALVWLVNHINLPNASLYPILVLSSILIIFTFTDLLKGTTITACARWLGLATEEKKEGNEFGVELPEELGSRLSEMIVTDETLAAGNHLSDMHFPEGTLVMIIKRGRSIIVPNGRLELQKGDVLLTIAQEEN